MQHQSSIAFILTNWPNAFPSLQAQDDWSNALSKYDHRVVLAAVKKYHSESASDFKPGPGAIRKLVKSMEEERGKIPVNFEEAARNDKERSIRAARSWVRNIDVLERDGRLSMACSTVIEACETIAKLSTDDTDRYIAKRALDRLDELGVGPDMRFGQHWRARLGTGERPESGSDGLSSWEALIS